MLDDAPLLGTPEEIITQLKRLEAVASRTCCSPHRRLGRRLRTFAEKSLPAFDQERRCISPSPRFDFRTTATQGEHGGEGPNNAAKSPCPPIHASVGELTGFKGD